MKAKRRIFFACVIMVFFVFLFGVSKNDKNDISFLADETLDFLETICMRYDGYAMGHKATSFKEISDKAKGLTEWVDDQAITDPNALLEYIQKMDLCGIIVTDENAALAAQVDIDGRDFYTAWEPFLSNENRINIVQNPMKMFCTELRAYDTNYDTVLVARKDEKGLVLCYKETTIAQTDLYETSIDKTLTNNTFHKNPKIVITDSKTVLASNNEFLKVGMDITDEPFSELGSKNWAHGKLIRLVWKDNLWYGKREVYGQYLIYIFYPVSEVFTNILPFGAVFVAGVALLVLALMMFRDYSEKSHIEKEKKQLQTIRAISGLYVATSILHLDSNRIEGIELTDRAQKVLDETTEAKKVANLLAKRIIAPQDQKRYVEFLDFDTMRARLETGEDLTAVFQDVDGVWFSTFLVPMEYDKKGNVTKVLFASRNINDYKQKEERYKEELRKTARDAKIANAAKTSFLRRMSHDIRTPINGIRGMAVLAKKSIGNSEKTKDCIEKILYSSDYLQELLDDILRLSKLESGKIFFEEKPFDLKELITQTAEFIKEQANEKQVHFSLDMAQVTHTHVIASPLHLRQVMQNILSNAIKFNRPGGRIDVICRESAHLDPKKMIFEFICSDTGIGIDPAFQKEIFEPFAQETDSARSNYMGVGLGLPIVNEILKQRGGTISFTSEKNEGSTFHITVPLTIDPNAKKRELEARQEKEENMEAIKLSNIRILLAEDNELNMEIAKELLEEKQAIVVPAQNGNEAIQIFANSKPYEFDAILMDIMMPKLNGFDAAKAIRAMNRADASTIPIFAMTANAFVEDRKQSQKAGMNEHFSKPLDMEVVIRTIDRYCKKNRNIKAIEEPQESCYGEKNKP